MARILSISSQIVAGHVGHSASVFPLQCLGHEVMALPTILLPYHPGHGSPPPASIVRTDADTLEAVLTALEARGWLDGLDAVFTGYFAAAEQARLAAYWIERLKRASDCLYFCDPVLGDEGTDLYVAEDIALAMRDLVTLADIASPNRFEYRWLTGRDPSPGEPDAPGWKDVGPDWIVTSAAEAADWVETWVLAGSDSARLRTARIADPPKGTGDLFAGLALGRLLNGSRLADAAANAVSSVADTLLLGRGRSELALVDARDCFADPQSQVERHVF